MILLDCAYRRINARNSEIISLSLTPILLSCAPFKKESEVRSAINKIMSMIEDETYTGIEKE